MKLIRFSVRGGAPMMGITDGQSVAAMPRSNPNFPSDMNTLIEHWVTFADEVKAIRSYEWPLGDVRLLAPIARPGKIFAIGLNYADHAAEGGLEIPKYPMWFSKPGTAVNGPYDSIERPLASTHLDYEAEMVAVIGKRARHLTPENATQAIFGYCVGNDVSVRDWQLRTSQVTIGKSFDTHAPFGPWITTAESIDAKNLAIASYVNGEQRQKSRTSNLIFDVAAQLSDLSQAMTLEPGDIIFTGTPSGVAAVMKPPRWLRARDVVRVEIEGLGMIENTVIDEIASH